VFRFVFCSNIDRIFDMKCASEKNCWYCKNLCDYCLKPALFDSSNLVSSNSEVLLKFCCSECKEHFVCSETQFQITIQLIPTHANHDHYLKHGHKELFRIQGHVVIAEDKAVTFHLSARMDSEFKYYVLYSEKQHSVRKFFEMSISSTGHAISFLPHVKMGSDNYEQDLVLFDYLSVHMEVGFLLFEKYQEGYIPDTVVIPIGIDSAKDPFYDTCNCFPKQFLNSKWKFVLNSLNAYKLLKQLKNQELLTQHLIGTAVNQLQSNLLPTCGVERKVFSIAHDILCETISYSCPRIFLPSYILVLVFSC